ncbi:MAG: hypothetical protein AAFP84_22640 [Actinomycetota bacterium]
MSWAGDLLTHDGVQSVASVAALFTGGFVGARVSGVVRVHMEARSWLWNELHQLDGHLRQLELQLQSEASVIQRSLSSRIDRLRCSPIEDLASTWDTLDEMDLDPFEHAAVEWRRSFNEAILRADLLTWSEREAFGQYRRLLPSAEVAAAKSIRLDLDAATLLLAVYVEEARRGHGDEADLQDTWAQLEDISHRLESATEIVPRPSELKKWIADRRARTANVRSDIHRRLRPRLWQRPADWRHTIGLAVSKISSLVADQRKRMTRRE